MLSPMTTGFGFEEGVPDETLHRVLQGAQRRRRDGRVAFGAVAPEGRVEEKLPWMWREDIGERLQPLVAALHDEGALACLQLGHGGRQVSPVVTGMQPVAPSPVPPPVHVKEPPHELDARRGRGGRRRPSGPRPPARPRRASTPSSCTPATAISCTSSSPLRATSARTHYGGDTIAERARFGAEVVARIRREAPGLALVVRLNGDDITPGGIGPADALEAAQRARRGGRARVRHLGGRLRLGAVHDPAARRPRGLARRGRVVPEARAVGAGADGRRHRAAGRRRGGDPARRLRRRSSSGGR